MSAPARPPHPEDMWDRFIDALDYAGQRGGAHAVCVPAFGSGLLAGRAFGELTRDDVQQLARIAHALGRRGDTIVTLWKDTQRRLRPRPPKKPRRTSKS